MEYVFEDFVFGFINKEIKDVKAYAQTRTTYLDKNRSFQLKPDLFLKIGSKNIIADTKYKIIYKDIKDTKNGISQSDLYQMLAYAVRFKVDEIKLFYPETINIYQDRGDEIIIRDELANGSEIKVTSYQLPIINRKLFEDSSANNNDLSDSFRDTKLKLIKRLKEILGITDLLTVSL